MPPGQSQFACRACYNLTYSSVKRHDKRVDAVVRNPEAIRHALESPDTGQQLLGFLAAWRLLENTRQVGIQCRPPGDLKMEIPARCIQRHVKVLALLRFLPGLLLRF